MTKEEILQTFSDINYAYNNCTKYDTLKRMLDELIETCNKDIKVEINQLPSYVARFNGGSFAIHIDKEGVLQIINKHIESEDTV